MSRLRRWRFVWFAGRVGQMQPARGSDVLRLVSDPAALRNPGAEELFSLWGAGGANFGPGYDLRPRFMAWYRECDKTAA